MYSQRMSDGTIQGRSPDASGSASTNQLGTCPWEELMGLLLRGFLTVEVTWACPLPPQAAVFPLQVPGLIPRLETPTGVPQKMVFEGRLL